MQVANFIHSHLRFSFQFRLEEVVRGQSKLKVVGFSIPIQDLLLVDDALIKGLAFLSTASYFPITILHV
ncbi:hypothetical protein RJT34_08193 [Clitoria ternatea]|uniref:Uncharacterized protein n=1 Tax=Clitoria ternatea TaxID=43366 RepID=A0AAN9PTY8_CLITE